MNIIDFPKKKPSEPSQTPVSVRINYFNVQYLEALPDGSTRLHFTGGGSVTVMEGLPDMDRAMVNFLLRLGGR